MLGPALRFFLPPPRPQTPPSKPLSSPLLPLLSGWLWHLPGTSLARGCRTPRRPPSLPDTPARTNFFFYSSRRKWANNARGGLRLSGPRGLPAILNPGTRGFSFDLQPSSLEPSPRSASLKNDRGSTSKLKLHYAPIVFRPERGERRSMPNPSSPTVHSCSLTVCNMRPL